MEANKTAQDMNVKVPLISKIAYGFGDVGCNFSWMFVSNFLMIFYTDVCAIPMTAVSLLMLLSRFWDAINDPLIGSLSDRTNPRWGRYRPWLLIGAPLTSLVLVGYSKTGEMTLPMSLALDKELTFKTVFRYRHIYPMAIDAVAAGKVNLKGIVTDIFDFDDIQNAMDKSVSDKANIVKAVVKIAKEG